MSRKVRVIIGIALLLIAGVAGFWVAWKYIIPRWRASQAQEQAAASGSQSGIDIQSPTLRHTENGKLAWQLRLQRIALTRGGTTVGASGVKEGLIYDPTGKAIVRVTARAAQGDTLQKNFQLDGDVRIVAEQGALITTDQVRWTQAEQKLSCPGPVTVKGKDAVIASSGVDFFVNQNLIIAPNQVKMHSGNNKVVGQGLRYDVKTTSFTLQQVQMVLDTQQARRRMKGARK